MTKPAKQDINVGLITIAFILLLMLILVIFLFGIYKQGIIKVTEEECIEKGSMQHKVVFSSDYELGTFILSHNKTLGPYFDYNFCEE